MTDGKADPLAPFGRPTTDIEIAQNGEAATIVDDNNPDAWLTSDLLVEVRR